MSLRCHASFFFFGFWLCVFLCDILVFSYLAQEEEMLRETVSRFAKERIAPKVREMDERSELDSGEL
jgi:alkylation response protein AidB-like acyl-CoA dehydrogenase